MKLDNQNSGSMNSNREQLQQQPQYLKQGSFISNQGSYQQQPQYQKQGSIMSNQPQYQPQQQQRQQSRGQSQPVISSAAKPPVDLKAQKEQLKKEQKEREKQEKLRKEQEKKERKEQEKLAKKQNVSASVTSGTLNKQGNNNQVISNSVSDNFLGKNKSQQQMAAPLIPKGRYRCQVVYLDESVKNFDVDVSFWFGFYEHLFGTESVKTKWNKKWKGNDYDFQKCDLVWNHVLSLIITKTKCWILWFISLFILDVSVNAVTIIHM